MSINKINKELDHVSPSLIEVKFDDRQSNVLLTFKDSFKLLDTNTRLEIINKLINSLMEMSYGTPLISIHDIDEDFVVKTHGYYEMLSLNSQSSLLNNISESIKIIADQLSEQAKLTNERLQ
jgi:hypothetical protein